MVKLLLQTSKKEAKEIKIKELKKYDSDSDSDGSFSSDEDDDVLVQKKIQNKINKNKIK